MNTIAKNLIRVNLIAYILLTMSFSVMGQSKQKDKKITTWEVKIVGIDTADTRYPKLSLLEYEYFKNGAQISEEQFLVERADIVEWKVADNLGISSIMIKSAYNDIFASQPYPVKDYNNLYWYGSITKARGTMIYTIFWVKDGIVYATDPKIKVNPNP